MKGQDSLSNIGTRYRRCYHFIFAYVDYQVPGVDLSLLSFITFFRLFRLYHLLRHFRRNEFAYLTAFLAITIIFSSISILFVEPSNPQATIVNIGDALWWSISTNDNCGVWRRLSCDHRRKGDRSNTDVCRDWNPLDICSCCHPNLWRKR